MPVKLGQVRYISNVVGHVYKCFFVFVFFLYIYLMHWSDPRRHLCCLDTQYVMDAGNFFFPLSFVFVHVLKDVSPHPTCIFRTESLAFTHILHTRIQVEIILQSSNKNHDGTTSL